MPSGYQNDAGVQQQEAGFGYLGTLWTESNGGPLTASPTHTQAGATLIPQMFTTVLTVASAGDAVRLPPAIPGLELTVVNASAANAMQVYASGTDTINGIAGNVGTPQIQQSVGFYICATAGVWWSTTVATGVSGNFATFSTQSANSTAGGTQGTSVLITAMNFQITGPASGATGVLLPPSKAGMEITIGNSSGSATPPTVFASGADTINGGSGATGITGPANNTVMIFYCFATGAWSNK